MGEINTNPSPKKKMLYSPCLLCEVRKPAEGKSNKKGEYYVVDNSCNTDNFVGARVGDWLYVR